MKQVFTLTSSAIEQIKILLQKRQQPAMGIRIGVKTKGCSGLAYTLEYVDQQNPSDECVEQDGVRVMIAPEAVLFIVGTEMDFVQDKLHSGFVFTNPNEKGKCGCGKSFHV
jgi:iron-sulfur cluster assembly protein